LLTDGSKKIAFSNGTTIYDRPPTPKNATAFEKATAEQWRREDPNGTTEIRFFNGTHIKSEISTTGPPKISYISQPQA